MKSFNKKEAKDFFEPQETNLFMKPKETNFWKGFFIGGIIIIIIYSTGLSLFLDKYEFYLKGNKSIHCISK